MPRGVHKKNRYTLPNGKEVIVSKGGRPTPGYTSSVLTVEGNDVTSILLEHVDADYTRTLGYTCRVVDRSGYVLRETYFDGPADDVAVPHCHNEIFYGVDNVLPSWAQCDSMNVYSLHNEPLPSDA